jgi:uncharacterized damage-inducible protein DinB
MPSATDILLHTLTGSKQLMVRYCDDLKPDEYLHRPTPRSNCVAWLLGHLILTDRRILTTMLPSADVPALPDGFEKRFSRDEGVPQASEFGDVTILLPLFIRMRDALINRVMTASSEELDKQIDPPHPRFKIVWEAVNFMGLHVAMHAGQITIIRRSLGRPPLI